MEHGLLPAARQAICSICHSCDEVRQQVVELGGLVPLTDLLTSPDLEPPYRQALAEAIFHCIAGSKVSVVHFRRLDGMRPLIQLLKSSALTSQSMGAFAVQAMCQSSTALARLFSQQGGLQSLSAMLHSSSNTCQQQAALAISSFCSSQDKQPHFSNFCPTDEVMEHNVLHPLCELLGSPSGRSQVAGLRAVGSVCKDGSYPPTREAARMLDELGGLQLTINLLRSPSALCQEAAANALSGICHYNQDASQKVAAAEGLLQLVHLLDSSPASCQSAAAGAIQTLFKADCTLLAMPLPTVVHSLSSLLDSPSPTCQQAAVLAIKAIQGQIGQDEDGLQAIFAALQPLVCLLSSPAAAYKWDAAEIISLSLCSKSPPQHEVILLQAAQRLLDHLLASKTPCQADCARALAALCPGNGAVQRHVVEFVFGLLMTPSASYWETAATVITQISQCCGVAGFVQGFIEIGGLQCLIGLLPAMPASGSASVAIAINSIVIMAHRDDGPAAVELLVHLLSSPSVLTQERAASAISALFAEPDCSGDRYGHAAHRLRPRLAAMGVLKPLISLLSSTSVSCQCQAARAIGHLCLRCDAGLEVFKLGGLQLLIKLLQRQDSTCQEHAAAALHAVCRCKRTCQPNLTELSRTPCLQCLLDMLISSSAGCQQQAAAVIGWICRADPAAQVQLLELGSMPRLINLLKAPCADVQAQSAWAIKNICTGNGAVKQHLLELGGLQPLIDMLSSTAEDCRWGAVDGLEVICRDDVSVQQQLLVLGALQPPIDLLWDFLSRETAAEIISFLYSSSNTTEQQAMLPDVEQPLLGLITSAPGKPEFFIVQTVGTIFSAHTFKPLISLLSSTSAKCQEKVAFAMRVLCNNDSIMLQLVEQGCLSPLIKLLSSGSASCQDEALEAAQHICSNCEAAYNEVRVLPRPEPVVSLHHRATRHMQLKFE